MTFIAPFVLLAVAIAALGATIAKRSKNRVARSRLASTIALACSLGAILALTLVPTRGANERELAPLVRLFSDARGPDGVEVVLDALGNALLFLPLGAALCLLGLRVRRTALVACSSSLAVEIAQLVVPGRTTSIDDVLLNTLGALAGHAIVLRWAP